MSLPEVVQEDQEGYIVEQILKKKRTADGKYKYYIKWQGFPPEDSTWEPEENLVNVRDMIEDFERNLKE